MSIQNPPPMRTPIVEGGGVDLQLTPPWTRFFMYLQDQIERAAASGGGGSGGGSGTGFTWQVLAGATGTVTLNHANATHFRVNMVGDITLANPIGLVDNTTFFVKLFQDATGGRIVTFGSAWPAMRDIVPVPSTARLIHCVVRAGILELIGTDDQG